MSPRLQRAQRALDRAERREREAKTAVMQANQAVSECSGRIARAQHSGAHLGTLDLPLELRARYSQIGAHHLTALNQERGELREIAAQKRSQWDATRVAAKSFAKLVERIRHNEREERRRSDAAELLDIVGARSAQTANRSTP